MQTDPGLVVFDINFERSGINHPTFNPKSLENTPNNTLLGERYNEKMLDVADDSMFA